MLLLNANQYTVQASAVHSADCSAGYQAYSRPITSRAIKLTVVFPPQKKTPMREQKLNDLITAVMFIFSEKCVA